MRASLNVVTSLALAWAISNSDLPCFKKLFDCSSSNLVCRRGDTSLSLGVTMQRKAVNPAVACALLCASKSSCAGFNVAAIVQSMSIDCQLFGARQPSSVFSVNSSCVYYSIKTTEICANVTPRMVNLRNASAYQISQYATFTDAIRALDGNLDMNFYAESCSCTSGPSSLPAWWVVDMATAIKIYKIIIYPRSSCCPDRTKDIIAGVMQTFSKSLGVTLGSYPVCLQYRGQPPPDVAFEMICNPAIPAAPFLVIQQPANGPGYLTLCEVLVYTFSI